MRTNLPREDSELLSDDLTCAGGQPWVGANPCGGYHCVGCFKIGMALERQFLQDVADGKCDELGFTPTERRAAQRKGKL